MKSIEFNKSSKKLEYVNKRICKTLRCNRCGCPVLKTDNTKAGYSYQCMKCDEDLFKFEVYRGKPYSHEEFEYICGITNLYMNE